MMTWFQAEAMRHGMELENPTDRLQEVRVRMIIRISRVKDDDRYCKKFYDDCQVQKEEAPPMGPPPSRKMTRTPPVYQQVFSQATSSYSLTSSYRFSFLLVCEFCKLSRRRGEATKRRHIMADETVSW